MCFENSNTMLVQIFLILNYVRNYKILPKIKECVMNHILNINIYTQYKAFCLLPLTIKIMTVIKLF